MSGFVRVEQDLPGRSDGARGTLGRLLVADGCAFAVLCLLALCLGLLLNAGRRDALPLRYASPAARLQSEVGRLLAGGQTAGPVAQIGLPALQRLSTERSGLILDARPSVFYRAGHIPGALNLARESFAEDYARLRVRLDSDRGRPIAVYCSDADCPDSGLVASALKQLGFRSVKEFAPGWAGWTAAGLPEETAPPP